MKISFLNNAGTRSRYSLKYEKIEKLKESLKQIFSQLKLTRTFLNHIENEK